MEKIDCHIETNSCSNLETVHSMFGVKKKKLKYDKSLLFSVPLEEKFKPIAYLYQSI